MSTFESPASEKAVRFGDVYADKPFEEHNPLAKKRASQASSGVNNAQPAGILKPDGNAKRSGSITGVGVAQPTSESIPIPVPPVVVPESALGSGASSSSDNHGPSSAGSDPSGDTKEVLLKVPSVTETRVSLSAADTILANQSLRRMPRNSLVQQPSQDQKRKGVPSHLFKKGDNSEDLEVLYAELLDKLQFPPKVKDKLIKSQSRDKKRQMIDMNRGVLAGETHVKWGELEMQILNSMAQAKVPDIDIILQLRSILTTANQSNLRDFLKESGLVIILKCIDDCLCHQRLSDFDYVVLFELISCLNIVLNSAIGMNSFLETPGSLKALARCLVYESRPIAVLVLEILSVCCYFSEDAALSVVEAIRQVCVAQYESPFARLTLALITEDIELRAKTMSFINGMLTGVEDAQERFVIREELRRQDLINRLQESVLAAETDLQAKGSNNMNQSSSAVRGMVSFYGSRPVSDLTATSASNRGSVEPEATLFVNPRAGLMRGLCATPKAQKKFFSSSTKLRLFVLDAVTLKWGHHTGSGSSTGADNDANPNNSTRNWKDWQFSPDDCVPVSTIVSIQPFTTNVDMVKLTSYCFEVETASRTIAIGCDTKAELQDWLTALEAARNRYVVSTSEWHAKRVFSHTIEGFRGYLAALKREKDVFDQIAAWDHAAAVQGSGLDLEDLSSSMRFLQLEAHASGCEAKLHKLVHELLLIPPQQPSVWDAIVGTVRKFRPLDNGSNKDSSVDATQAQLQLLPDLLTYKNRELGSQYTQMSKLAMLVIAAERNTGSSSAAISAMTGNSNGGDYLAVEAANTRWGVLSELLANTAIKGTLKTLLADGQSSMLASPIKNSGGHSHYYVNAGTADVGHSSESLITNFNTPQKAQSLNQATPATKSKTPMAGQASSSRWATIRMDTLGEASEFDGEQMGARPQSPHKTPAKEKESTNAPSMTAFKLFSVTKAAKKQQQQQELNQLQAEISRLREELLTVRNSALEDNERSMQSMKSKLEADLARLRNDLQVTAAAKDAEIFALKSRIAGGGGGSDDSDDVSNNNDAAKASKFDKFIKMKKMLPEPAIRQKMTLEGIKSSAINAFFDVGIDPKFEKFVKMKKILPEQAVRQKMSLEGFCQGDIDSFFNGTLPPYVETISPAEGDQEPLMAPTAQTSTALDSKFEKFVKMKKILPEPAVRQKMAIDGFSPEDIDAFFESTVPQLTDSAAVASPQQAVSVNANNAVNIDPKFAKFVAMAKMLPEGAVRQKMGMEGLSTAEIDAFFDKSSSGSVGGTIRPSSLSSPLRTNTAGVSTLATSPSNPASPVDAKLAKFITMRKMLPEGAIRQKMAMDGISQVEIDRFFSGNLPTAPSAGIKTPQQGTFNGSNAQPTSVTDPKLAKFATMKKLLPEGAIRQKMAMEGISAVEIDAFFQAATPSVSSPSSKSTPTLVAATSSVATIKTKEPLKVAPKLEEGPPMGMAAKEKVIPKSKMKGIFWTKLKADDLTGTMWCDFGAQGDIPLEESEIDMIDAWFGANPTAAMNSASSQQRGGKASSPITASEDDGDEKESKEETKRTPELKKASVIDTKKVQNVLIAMGKLRHPPNIVVEWVRDLNDAVLTQPFTETLLNVLPSPEEAIALRVYGSPDALDKASGFFWHLVGVSRLQQRLEYHLLHFKWEGDANEAFAKVKRLSEAANEVRESEPMLGKLMALILSVGNYLNGGSTRGQAYGVRLDVLKKVMTIKGNTSNQGSLVTFLAVLCEKRMPELLSFSDNWVNVIVACEMSRTELDADIRQLTQAVDKAGTELRVGVQKVLEEQGLDFAEPYRVRLESFLAAARPKLTDLQRKNVEARDTLTALMARFGENINQHSVSASENGEADSGSSDSVKGFFRTIYGFAKAFKSAVDDIHRKRAEEERKAKNEKLKGIRRSSSSSGNSNFGNNNAVIEISSPVAALGSDISSATSRHSATNCSDVNIVGEESSLLSPKEQNSDDLFDKYNMSKSASSDAVVQEFRNRMMMRPK